MTAIVHALLLLLLTITLHADARQTFDDKASIENAFIKRQQNVQLLAFGKVEKILADDNQGSRHQRIIVRINASLTVLIAHNIDIAKPVRNLKPGDILEFYGEYDWNKKGGVVHWTHHDPRGRHLAGWLKHKGTVYQ